MPPAPSVTPPHAWASRHTRPPARNALISPLCCTLARRTGSKLRCYRKRVDISSRFGVQRGRLFPYWWKLEKKTIKLRKNHIVLIIHFFPLRPALFLPPLLPLPLARLRPTSSSSLCRGSQAKAPLLPPERADNQKPPGHDAPIRKTCLLLNTRIRAASTAGQPARPSQGCLNSPGFI